MLGINLASNKLTDGRLATFVCTPLFNSNNKKKKLFQRLINSEARLLWSGCDVCNKLQVCERMAIIAECIQVKHRNFIPKNNVDSIIIIFENAYTIRI